MAGSERGSDSHKATTVATAPARWVLEKGIDGLGLTQTNALARAVVREAAARWPGWWDAELFGPPHREAEVRVLESLHDGLRRLKLVRRRGRQLHTTPRGRELLRDPEALLQVLSADLGTGDPFSEAVAAAVTKSLESRTDCSHDDLAAAALARVEREGWRSANGDPPTHEEISWLVLEVTCRGEAYGLIQRIADPDEPRLRSSRIALSDAGRAPSDVARGESSVAMAVLVFDAELVAVGGVRARLAVGADQHLTELHDAIQEAFGWCDDHLYSFWLDGRFWGDEGSEFTTPETPDEGVRTADVSLAELGLTVGRRVAYVFDFGDDWRVRLTLREQTESDRGSYPRVLNRKGEAPPQYPGLEDE